MASKLKLTNVGGKITTINNNDGSIADYDKYTTEAKAKIAEARAIIRANNA